MQDPTTAAVAHQWDRYADDLRAKLPVAPEGLLNGYVRIAPWLAIIFGGISILFLLGVLLLGAALSPFLLLGGAAGLRAGGMLALTGFFGLVASGLDFVGGWLMLGRRLLGWWILALALAVSILTNLFSVSLFGLIISLLIAYVHLQVKPRYH
jgi:hypothetical protein